MLFYLFGEVEAGRAKVRSVLDLKLQLAAADLRRRQRQVGSLAGAAHLLKNNTGVLRRAQ